MDLFEFDFFRDWELEQQCHYEQDRSVLKKKEWERRTQEVQQDEDLFSSGFNLFGEPYKTNKGDALANRVQNTLGNYDEMKELLTSHSNQSHLVGIPKNLIPQTPIEKDGYLRFFPDGQKSIVALSQQSTSLQSTSMPPPPCPVLTSSSLLHDHQGTKVSNSSDWTRGGHNSGCMQTSHAVGYSNHKIKNGVSSIEYNGHEDQGDTSSVASSSSSRRHTQQSKSPCADHTNKENNNTLSPKEQEFVPHSSSSPVASTSLLSSAPNFSTGLHYKPSVVQQKPTAYVRPMDGQDQITNDSPELKPHMEIGDHAPEFGRLMEEKVDAKVKSKLPRLTLPQSGEVSLLNDSSCIEEILREMTHSWPPPLSGIHTPGKADQPKFPLPSKEPQNLIPGYNGQKLCNAPGKKPPDLPTPHKSMLEDDLKLSSDEDESELAEEKTKPKSAHLKLPGSTDEISQLGQVNGASGSSTESESSSESDSDSESSSSESEGNRESLCATPEPEPPSTNKWQLDKWLNKVNPQNKVLISTQVDSHGIASSQSEVELGLCNTESTMSSAQPETKDRVLLSPIQEKAKFKTGQMTPDLKGGKLRSPATELPVPGKMTGKKLPRKLESVPTLDDDIILKPCKVISPSPKEKEPPPVELSRARNKIGVGKSAPRKEPRPLVTATAVSDKKKQRGPNKIIPKSKEFIETESSSSECHSDAEEQVKNFSNTQQHKDKENTDNVQMISNLNNAGNTLVLDASVDLIDDVLYSTSKQMDTVRSGLLLGHFEEIRSLWVKIDLCLLTRIPGKDPCDPLPIETRTWENRNLQLLMATNPACKSKRKSKSKNCGAVSGKKIRLEKGALLLPPCISPKHSHKPSTVKESLKKQPKKKDEKLLPPSLTPLLGEQDQVYRADEGSTYSQENSTIPDISSCPNSTFLQSCLASSVSSSSTKHRKSDTKGPNNETDICSKPAETVCSHIQESDLWLNPTIPPELLEPRRPKLVFDDIVHKADHYMLEAKKLKHKADALMEKFGKALNYTDGALSFIECGNAMERDPLEAKSPYTMYSETVELIRYAMRLKNFTSQSATVAEKKLAVLCYRCLSLLYLRMFRLKKDHAVKYSRTLMEYFKKSSPWGSNGKVTSSPLPLSLSSSPGSSVGSSNSIPPGPCSAGTVTIPQRIHHMAASHVNITTNILRSYEHWDTADKLSQESKEFFQELNLTMEPLTQHSTMTELVRYVRQGLHWLRIEARLL